MNESIIPSLVLLTAVGAGAQLLAWHAKVPSILFLLIAGMLVGPGLSLLTPGALLGELTFPMVSLGAALVLFEGGLSARIQDLRVIGDPVARLVSIGLLTTSILTAVAAHFVVRLPVSLSCLLGAILAVTGPTVIGPLLHHVRPGGHLASILKYEGIVSDPIGAILALIVFQVIQVERVESALSLVIWGVLRAAGIAAALGLLGSFLYVVARKKEWIPAPLSNAVLLPLVLSMYALSNRVQPESGLLAVTVMGVALASQNKVDIEGNVEFAEHIRTLLISVLFVLLTVRIDWSDLRHVSLTWGGFVLVLIFLVRPLSVLLSTWRTKLTWRERTFLAGMAPRGIVAAAMASVFSLRLGETGQTDAEVLMPLTFFSIAICVVVYGLGARPLVHLLGLSGSGLPGVLFLGANTITRAIASELEQVGIKTVLVDTDRRNVVKARALGLRAHHGQILSTHVMNRLDLAGIGQLIAATSDDEANSLAVQEFRGTFGVDKISQVACEGSLDSPEVARDKSNRSLGHRFSPDANYDELERWSLGGKLTVTSLTKELSFENFLEAHGQGALPLLAISADGIPRVFQAAKDPPLAGERVLSFMRLSE